MDFLLSLNQSVGNRHILCVNRMLQLSQYEQFLTLIGNGSRAQNKT